MRMAICLSAEWASAETLPARTTTSRGACEISSDLITWRPPARCRRLVESPAIPRARTTSFSISPQTLTAAPATANPGSAIRRARILLARRRFLLPSPDCHAQGPAYRSTRSCNRKASWPHLTEYYRRRDRQFARDCNAAEALAVDTAGDGVALLTISRQPSAA